MSVTELHAGVLQHPVPVFQQPAVAFPKQGVLKLHVSNVNGTGCGTDHGPTTNVRQPPIVETCSTAHSRIRTSRRAHTDISNTTSPIPSSVRVMHVHRCEYGQGNWDAEGQTLTHPSTSTAQQCAKDPRRMCVQHGRFFDTTKGAFQCRPQGSALACAKKHVTYGVVAFQTMLGLDPRARALVGSL